MSWTSCPFGRPGSNTCSIQRRSASRTRATCTPLWRKQGFKEIRIRADDQAVTSGDLDTMTTVLLRVGPLGRIVRENPELRPSAETRVRAALATQGDPTRVALHAATWIATARA